MSQMYEKACNTCNQQIRMENINGKWGAYEIGTNDYHKCGEGKTFVRNNFPNKEQQKLTLEDLDLRVKMIESILGVQLKK